MKTCENCGCRIYEFGCVNCNEEAYIEAQWAGVFDEDPRTIEEIAEPDPFAPTADAD